MLISLSIVIITHNESNHIEKCLSSLYSELPNCKNIIQSEIILVDSNSKDDTLLKAKRYSGIKIISLKSDNYYSAAMGRNIGALVAKNEYILFLDGDIELQPGWLDKSISIMLSKNADGIRGDLVDIQYNSHDEILKTRVRYKISELKPSLKLGGNLLINRKLLLDCGNYNPYIRNNEESEMYSRFLKYDGLILQDPDIMGKHHTDYIGLKTKIKNIINIDMAVGKSLAFKNSLVNKSYIQFMKIYSDFFRTLLISLITLILVSFYIISHSFLFLIIILSINILNIFLYVTKKKTLHAFMDYVLSFRFLIGLFRRTKKFSYSYQEVK